MSPALNRPEGAATALDPALYADAARAAGSLRQRRAGPPRDRDAVLAELAARLAKLRQGDAPYRLALMMIAAEALLAVDAYDAALAEGPSARAAAARLRAAGGSVSFACALCGARAEDPALIVHKPGCGEAPAPRADA